MIFNLTSGEAIHIGPTITLTVLAVKGNLVHFGLERLEESLCAQDIDKGYDEADLKHKLKHKWNQWDLN